jgi:lysophospholipase L1-like esterase
MITNPDAMSVLCYGDSNTYGQKPDKTGRFAADVRWTGVMQDELGEDFYVIEEGLSSRTTDLEYDSKPGRNGLTYLLPCIESHLPISVVILMLGTNDLKIEFKRSVEDIVTALERLVDTVRARSKDQEGKPSKVILVSPAHMNDKAPTFAKHYIPDTYNHDSYEKSKELAAAIQELAQRSSCHFVDASTIARVGDDGLHLAQAGHTALGMLLTDKVREAAQFQTLPPAGLTLG